MVPLDFTARLFKVQVDGEGKFERVSGTNVGGGTYWGLGKLLTKCKRL